MSAEMVTSVTALAVAMLSGGATIYSTRSTLRLQRELQAIQASSAARAERTAALTEYSAAATIFLSACSELAQELTPNNRDGSRCVAKHEAYEAGRSRLQQTHMPARTHATADRGLDATLHALREAANALGSTIETWYQEVKRYDWHTDKRRPENLQHAQDACRRALSEFEDAVVTATRGNAADPSALSPEP